MNVYLFKRNELKVDWDEYEGFVVRAINEEEAREIVHYTYEDQWYVTLIASGVVGESGVILEAFKAG